jgi:hypothetical protein
MLNGGRAHILDAPHLTVFPGLAIAFWCWVQFPWRWLRDRLDPGDSRNRNWELELGIRAVEDVFGFGLRGEY